MVDVLLFAGQSNMSAYSPMINLGPVVPGYAQTALNEWTGAPPASIDSSVAYPYPTLAANPCLYNENTRGDSSGVFDSWGSYDKNGPQFSLSGGMGDYSSYGLELSFLSKYRAAHPGTTLACVKQSLGGTSIRGDWLPPTVQLGVAQAGGATSITLASSDFGTSAAYVGLRIRQTSGANSGSYGTITAFDAVTKIATLSGGWSGGSPTAGTGYGIERLQIQLLRTMMAQAAARLTTTYGAGGWRWAAFIWMQGESGAHSAGTAADDSQYLSDARALFAYVRSLSVASLPVCVGRIGNNWTNTNTYLISAGYPWAAIDASYYFTFSPFDGDGRRAAPQATRDGYLAGAIARRATQVTLGNDPNCCWWNNDDYPVRPPYNLTANVTDKAAYHWGGPGNMAAGERAFNALVALLSAKRLRLRTGGGRLRMRGAG